MSDGDVLNLAKLDTAETREQLMGSLNTGEWESENTIARLTIPQESEPDEKAPDGHNPCE